MTRLQTEPWSTPYSMVILPRCVAPSQILTDNMDQSKIPTIHSCCSRSKLEFHSFFAIDRINWETPRSFIPWFGPFQSAIRSDLKHRISCPRSYFLSRGDDRPDRAHSFRALVPVSEWEREEGGGCRASFVRIVTGVTELQLLQTRATKSQWQPRPSPGSVTVWQLCKKPTA